MWKIARIGPNTPKSVETRNPSSINPIRYNIIHTYSLDSQLQLHDVFDT